MNFGEAVRSVFTQYVGFSGRARRSEYWWFFLFSLLVYAAAGIIDVAAHTAAIMIIVELALLLPSLAVTVRRLHDTDRSGWWLLIGVIPIVGTIILIVWLCDDSTVSRNRFGDSPKYTGGFGQQPYLGQPPYPGQE